MPTFTVICRGWKAAGKWLESGLPLFNGRLIANARVSPPGVAAAGAGREMRKVEPREPVSSSASVPPWPRTRSAAMTSPRPEPPWRTLPRNGWNRLSRAFCGRPGPGVAHPDLARPSASAARTVTMPGCPPPRSPGRRCARGSSAPGRAGRGRPAPEVRRHLRGEADPARRRRSARSPAPRRPAAPARRPAGSGGSSSALPKVSVRSQRLIARASEPTSFGAVRRTAGSSLPRSGRPAAAPSSACCAGRG